ncbi:MAG: hypothetical protein J6B97_06590 [Bacteroidales bacterium]|nr:hypothetical protein [Bacteroidales bacterium]
MAKQEKITPQQAVEAVLGLVNMIDTGKLAKLSKLDEVDGLKTKLEDLESKISEQNKTISEFIKPEDFEQKIKKRDDAFSDAIKKVPTKIEVKTEPVTLKQDHMDILDNIKALYDNISKRHSVYCYLLGSKKMWFLYLFITAALSVGTTFLIMNTSSKEWAHRALIAAIDMNHQDPIGQYLTCRTEMPKDRKGYKAKVKAMEYDAKKILYLEDILADYIDGEFCIEQYHLQQTEHLVYATFCRFAGSKDIQVYNIHMKDGKVIEVTRRYKNIKKKKTDDPEFGWKVVKPIID